MLRLKVWVPDDLWNTIQDFGTRHSTTQVAAYWEPCGDALCLENPNGGAICGRSDDGAWIEFMQLPQNRAFLSEYNLGNSDTTAEYCLVFDLASRAVYLSTVKEMPW